MSSLDAINARFEDNKKSVARAERYKKQADDEVKYRREALAEAEKRAKVASKELEDARLALKDAEKAIGAINSDDEDTMAGASQGDDKEAIENAAVNLEDWYAILKSRSVCAWGECYVKKSDRFATSDR